MLEEIKSPAIKEVVHSLWNTVDRVKTKKIKYNQGAVEIAGCKHIIKGIALDWMYNDYENGIKKQIKNIKSITNK